MNTDTSVINVEFAALRAAADSLFAKARTLDNHLDTLHGHLEPLRATWVASGSTAGEAMDASEKRLRMAIAEIIGIIGQFSGKVNEAHDVQRDLENTTTNYFA
ncbi:MAG: WXG100 family type VII secretion target [Micromonosporaceae bacterium]